MKRLLPLLAALPLLLCFTTPAHAMTLWALKQAWVQAKYHTPDPEAQGKALDRLVDEAHAMVQSGDAETQVWAAAILATRAKFIGGTSALDDIREAKNLLEAAIPQNPPSVADGYADSLLGALYGKAPGWPISYGDLGKARKHFQRALALNPDGIDVNFLYGEFLADRGQDDAAKAALELALKAKPRRGHEAADAGRHDEAQAALAALH